MSLTDEQKKARAHGIGASESPAILGLDPHRSPMDVWLKKKGLVEDAQTHHTERGNFIELAIRPWASNRLGLDFKPCDPMTHPEHKVVLATPDGVALDGGKVIAVLEAKSPGPRTWHEWGDGENDAPARYVVQVAQQIAVTGAPVGYLASFIGDDLRIYHIERDRELEAEVIQRVEAFWRDHVEADVPPPADGSPAANEWLLRRFPRDTAPMVKLDGEAAALVASLREAKAALKGHEARVETIEQQIKELIGDAAGVEADGFGKITWKCNRPSLSTDWQAVAIHLGATKQHETQFTKTRPGARVLRCHFTKEK